MVATVSFDPMSFYLSPHFTMEEMTKTATGLPNIPDAQACFALRALCSAVLEPIRERTGPIDVNSGYRSSLVNSHPSVNGAIGSQHLRGEAADVRFGVTIETAFHAIRAMMDHGGLPVDQLILYVRARGKGWLHISHTHRYVARRDVRVDLLGKDRTVPYEDYRLSGGPLVLV